eukprot:m.478215 g.478215  ORF g.478215 m.478215 type:complete len:170 (+) comp57167_c0_seq3:477-986(+)
MRSQQFGNVHQLACFREIRGALAFLILEVHIGSVCEQLFHDSQAIGLGSTTVRHPQCAEQRRIPFLILGVHVCMAAPPEQNRQDRRLALINCKVESGSTSSITQKRIGAGIDQKLQTLDAADFYGAHQGALLILLDDCALLHAAVPGAQQRRTHRALTTVCASTCVPPA